MPSSAYDHGYYPSQYANHNNYHYPPSTQPGYYPPHQMLPPPHDQNGTPPPLPPPLNPKKKKLLKSPLTVIKNVFMKTTRPLRRQSSLAEADKKMKPAMSLRRQHSMMEDRHGQIHGPVNPNVDPRYQHYQQLPNRPPIPVNNGYAPGAYPNQGYRPYGHAQADPLNSTYQNFQTDNPYQQGGGYSNAGHDDYHHHDQDGENLYSNRALIELQESQQRPPAQRGLVRRHSLADRPSSALNFRRTPQSDMQRQRRATNQSTEAIEEPIYQSRGGSYMLKQDSSYDHGERFARPNYNTVQRGERARSIDPTYQSRKDMHRDHLYQSRTEMQQRITQGRQEMERGTSEAPSDSSSTTSGTPTHPIRDPIYVTRKELKESGFKTRTQLRDHLYQTRRETLDTMAEPVYGGATRSAVHHDPIYETNREHEVSQEVLSADQVVIEPVPPNSDGNRSDTSNHSDLEERLKGINIQSEDGSADGTQPFSKSRDGDDSQDTVINVQPITPPPQLGMSHSNDGTLEEITVIAAPNASLSHTMSPKPAARSTHLSNMIKRTAPHLLPPPPPPPLEEDDMPAPLPQEVDPTLMSMECRRKMMASRTSIETQYTSQASLPSTIGPPNASSTPYASDLSIAIAAQAGGGGQHSLVTPREPTTTRGEFDANGGVLSDPVWNVSLEIPKGALPAGRMQEIYFTVTDPRLSECVGGPPLDMENGLLRSLPLFVVLCLEICTWCVAPRAARMRVAHIM